MRKFIKNIFLYLLIFIIEYFVLLCMWGFFIPKEFNKNLQFRPAMKGHTFTRLKQLQNIENIDILFIGSSHTYRGFDTRIFDEYEISSFNLGSTSQTPIQTYYLLHKYLQNIKPKLIIIDLYPQMLSNDGVESSLDIIPNDTFSKSMFNMAFEINNLRTYNTVVFAYIFDLLNLRNTISEPLVHEEDIYIENGYVESSSKAIKQSDFDSNKWELNEKQLEYLEKIVQFTDSLGVNTLLLQVPYSEALFKSYTNNQEVDSILSSYGDYVNFNYICSLKDTVHFLDDDHLNKQGVRLFNEELISYLFENQYLFYKE